MEFPGNYGVYALGFFAQSLFGARLLVQLLLSERQGKVVSPTIFWQLSLAASFLFLIYGIMRSDLIIVLGQALSYFIYIRNLQLKNDWQKFPGPVRWFLFCLPFVTLIYVFGFVDKKLSTALNSSNLLDPVIAIGGIGQLLLNLRFIYQWYYSEKEGDSILPLGFWIISSIASIMVLVYAVYRIDPVLLVAQGAGTLVYVRNMVIHSRASSGMLR